jgi:hypothetical protein
MIVLTGIQYLTLFPGCHRGCKYIFDPPPGLFRGCKRITINFVTGVSASQYGYIKKHFEFRNFVLEEAAKKVVILAKVPESTILG